MKKKIVIFLFSLFLFSGCLSNSSYKVYVTNTKSFNLLSLDCYTGNNIDELYSFEITLNDTSFTCLSMLSISSTEIYLYIFNEMGVSMGEIIYDGVNLNLDSPFLPDNLKAEYIISDIQNIFYDKEIIKNHYERKGLKVSETYTDTITIRTIEDKNKTIQKITYYEDSISMHNYLRGYEYVLNRAEN